MLQKLNTKLFKRTDNQTLEFKSRQNLSPCCAQVLTVHVKLEGLAVAAVAAGGLALVLPLVVGLCLGDVEPSLSPILDQLAVQPDVQAAAVFAPGHGRPGVRIHIAGQGDLVPFLHSHLL